VFDEIGKDELIMAFFPCIYFCQNSMMMFYYTEKNYQCMTNDEKIYRILERNKSRAEFYGLLVKLCGTVIDRGLKLVIENPWSPPHYLQNNFLFPPSLVDKDRTRRGDVYVKPTAYWFIGFEPTKGFTWQKNKETKTIYGSKKASSAGLCSEERSLIHPDYARNFICDNILGITQKRANVQLTMF
jgi:hypothetical protein